MAVAAFELCVNTSTYGAYPLSVTKPARALWPQAAQSHNAAKFVQ
jgi:hypothetical protein